MQALDRNRWLRLSPLLDELLDLDPALRPARLAALRSEDAALAADLSALLDRAEAVERDGFLNQPAALPTPVAIGQTVGAYTIERELGQGGMGSVWLAHRTDGQYEGRVAIKFLTGGLMAGSAERFAREGSILARLAHPNIGRLIDAGVFATSGQRYLVLEYIDGEPIDRYCEEHTLDIPARVRLFLDVLAAVAHAHNRLILHRDIKPANILVTRAGEVKLLDFGIAKLLDDATVPAQATELTQMAGRVFTPAYAAPEQVEAGDVTTATDVYSLGVLLYVLLGGPHPTTAVASTPFDQLRAVVEVEPKKLSEAVARKNDDTAASAKLARELRGDLDNIVAKALKKAPAERYANAEQFADDLRRYLNHEPVTARPDAPLYLLAKFVRRHRAGVAASALAVIAIASGLGVALWQAREAQQQRVQAEGLIEFMLGDLRKKLEPVGRLEVLDAVGEKALAYYAEQEAGRLDAASLGRRARALHLIGRIAEQRGHLDEALQVFRRAAESTQELVQRYPRDGQRIFDHAQSVYWIGYMARRQGQAQEAETSFLQYRELTQQLVYLEPNNQDWRVEQAYAGQNLGVLYLDGRRTQQALEAFGGTRATWLDLVGAKPELNFELANTLGWIAKAREAQAEYDAAIRDQQAKIDALTKVPGADKNRRVQRLLANGYHEIGQLQLAVGQLALAEQAANEALKRLEGLLTVDATNVEWLSHVAFARLSLAEILLARGERQAAGEFVDQAASDTAKLAATDTKQAKWRLTLHGSLLPLQATLALAQMRPPPLKELEAYLASVKAAEAAGQPLESNQALTAMAQLALGDLLVRSHQSPLAAEEQWRSVASRLQAGADRGEPPAMTLLAQAQLRLGHVGEAKALAARVESSPYRHPAYADLRQRLARAGATVK